MASKAKRIVVPVTAADPQTKATREACRDCELYKMCCPRCSHVYFRLNYEDKGCPKCRSLGESVWGIRVAGGHFEVDQTIYDILFPAKVRASLNQQAKARLKGALRIDCHALLVDLLTGNVDVKKCSNGNVSRQFEKRIVR